MTKTWSKNSKPAVWRGFGVSRAPKTPKANPTFADAQGAIAQPSALHGTVPSILLLLLPLVLVGVCSVPAAESHAVSVNPPAKVTNPVGETQLATVTLTESAEQRLGIKTVAVVKKPRPQFRLYGGEIVLPLIKAGQGKTNQAITPVPPASAAEVAALAERQTLADGELRKAQVQLELAKIREERARTLVGTRSGSQRDLDDALAATTTAQTTFEVAELHRTLLGASVEEMTRLPYLWVRVPVYVGDLVLLDKAQPAPVSGLGGLPGSSGPTARWVDGPQFSAAAAASVDWFGQVDNADRAFQLGQRVGVSVPLRGEQESLVVPWAAVIIDVQGGQWVYERVQPHTYVRSRVEIARVADGEAILTAGPAPGVEVVTDGAAELFGTEFGVGH